MKACIFLTGLVALSLFATAQSSEALDRDARSNSAVNSQLSPEPVPAAVAINTPANRPFYTASKKNKKLHGSWSSTYSNGQLCDSGRFVKGLPDGEWKHWDRDGNLVYVRTYHADKYQRITNEFTRYNPRRGGYALSALYQRNRSQALKYLHSEYSFPQSATAPDRSVDEIVVSNDAGEPYQPVFEKSLHHGAYVNFSSDGAVADSGSYANGLREGLWVHRKDGLTERGTYVHGMKEREWRTYDASGKILFLQHFRHGHVSWSKRFRP